MVGGKSRRMGQDKAVLRLSGQTLLERMAQRLGEAAGSVSLVGDPVRYSGYGWPVLPDQFPGEGPLGGLCTALQSNQAEWNVLLACDMPDVTFDILRHLVGLANSVEADCVVPEAVPGKPQPLCAVYHQRCRPAAEAMLASGERRARDLLSRVNTHYWRDCDPSWFLNVNTPEDWERFRDQV